MSQEPTHDQESPANRESSEESHSDQEDTEDEVSQEQASESAIRETKYKRKTRYFQKSTEREFSRWLSELGYENELIYNSEKRQCYDAILRLAMRNEDEYVEILREVNELDKEQYKQKTLYFQKSTEREFSRWLSELGYENEFVYEAEKRQCYDALLRLAMRNEEEFIETVREVASE